MHRAKNSLFTKEEICRILDLPTPPPSTTEPPTPSPSIYAVTHDSRAIGVGALFVALKGDQHDGHAFVEQALKNGAVAALVEQPIAGSDPFTVLQVPSTLSAYRTLAAHYRRRFRAPFFAIGGSVGKTTTKEFLTALLKGKNPAVLKTRGSQNGFVGIPMTLFEVQPQHWAAVIEIGIDEPRSMVQHADLVRADFAILTAISEEHLELLGDLETVAKEESVLLAEALERGKPVVIQWDDPHLRKAAITWSRDYAHLLWLVTRQDESQLPPWCQNWVCFAEDASDQASISLRFRTSKDAQFALTCPLPGQHNWQNLAGAVTLAAIAGVTSEEMRRGLAEYFEAAPGRSEVRHLGGLEVLCDYYNANPASVRAALEVIRARHRNAGATNTKHAEGTWIFLGDMLELGTDELALHQNLSEALCKIPEQTCILFGPRMKALYTQLSGQAKFPVRWYDTMETLIQTEIPKIPASAQILIKGSRGMKMERVWEGLRTYLATKA